MKQPPDEKERGALPYTPFRFGVYLLLYTLFWLAMSVILYRAFFLEGRAAVPAGPYFFLAGLIWFVCAALRTLRPPSAHYHGRDPIVMSFALAGLVLILLANLV